MRLGVLDHPVDLLLDRPEPSWILIVFSLPVPLSFAVTCTMPLASMSKVTSIWGNAARSRRDSGQLEAAEQLVVCSDLAFTLIDLDLHRRLVVVGGGEGLRPLGRDGGVAPISLVITPPLGLDAEDSAV